MEFGGIDQLFRADRYQSPLNGYRLLVLAFDGLVRSERNQVVEG